MISAWQRIDLIIIRGMERDPAMAQDAKAPDYEAIVAAPDRSDAIGKPMHAASRPSCSPSPASGPE